MKSPKKYFMILALAGLIPLLIVLIFFVYFINGRSRERRGFFQNSPGSLAQTASRPTDEWGRRSKLTLQQLADNAQLVRRLKQIDWSAVKEENSAMVKEQKVISACIEGFRDQHPEFEEIALKNPQTGDCYVTVPARALGENFIGVRLVVTIPIRIDDNAQARFLLLIGFINIDRLNRLDRIDRMDHSDRLVGPTQLNQPAALAGKGGGATASTISPTKKMALIISFFLAFIVISIPISMLLIYRKIKKVVNPNPINSNPLNSYSPNYRGNRTYPGLRRGGGDHNYHPHPASPLKGEEIKGCPPSRGRRLKDAPPSRGRRVKEVKSE